VTQPESGPETLSAEELLHVAETVARSGEYRLVQVAGIALAIVPAPAVPQAVKRRRPRRKTGVLAPDDALWSIVGIGCASGPGDVSENKHRYLADAYLPKRS
jgi:hypothetical protein